MTYFKQAIKSLRVADYMLTTTYPAVKEPKLLLAIIEDISIAHTNLMKAVLEKNKSKPGNDFLDLFTKFKQYSLSLGFTDEDHDLIFKIQNIIQHHKEASVEFARKDKFIICLKHYRLEPIGVEDVKEYLFKSKHLLSRLET